MRTIRTKLFDSVTSKVKSTAQAFDPNSQVILFGSRARGDYRKDSDWDFLILMNKIVNEKEKRILRDEIYMTELATEQAITTFVENMEEWNQMENSALFHNINEEGIKI